MSDGSKKKKVIRLIGFGMLAAVLAVVSCNVKQQADFDKVEIEDA